MVSYTKRKIPNDFLSVYLFLKLKGRAVLFRIFWCYFFIQFRLGYMEAFRNY
jgi:hypothetical protein